MSWASDPVLNFKISYATISEITEPIVATYRSLLGKQAINSNGD